MSHKIFFVSLAQPTKSKANFNSDAAALYQADSATLKVNFTSNLKYKSIASKIG